MNATFLRTLFEEPSNCEAFLERSQLFERVKYHHQHPRRMDALPEKTHQQSAKLHCLYGQPILKIGRLRSTRMYPYACSKVYDLRQHTALTKWGPFLNDGTDRVDWEKVEAIIICLGYNIATKSVSSKPFLGLWGTPFRGSWSNSYPTSPNPNATPLELKDPYGITGTWYRVRAFLFPSLR